MIQHHLSHEPVRLAMPDRGRGSGPPGLNERAMVLAPGKVRCSPSSPCSRAGRDKGSRPSAGAARCAWLRVAPLLSCPPLRSTASRRSGRDGKTALQPNQKTVTAEVWGRTTHALQKADIFTRHRQHRAFNAPWIRHRLPGRGNHTLRTPQNMGNEAETTS